MCGTAAAKLKWVITQGNVSLYSSVLHSGHSCLIVMVWTAVSIYLKSRLQLLIALNSCCPFLDSVLGAGRSEGFRVFKATLPVSSWVLRNPSFCSSVQVNEVMLSVTSYEVKEEITFLKVCNGKMLDLILSLGQLSLSYMIMASFI